MSGRYNIDVMISSTSRDLPNHRREAIGAVDRSLMSTWAMEQLTASHKDPLTISLEFVEKSEIYVGIFHLRYGYIPDDPVRNPEQRSITELEYRRAVERRIPILIFIAKDHPVPADPNEAETFLAANELPSSKEKMAHFKMELEKRHLVAYFNSPADLRAKLIQALHDPSLIAQALTFSNNHPPERDTGVPRPPSLYALPAYALQNNAFIGRRNEIKILNDWLSQGEPVLIFEAIGGMGKSALTWSWVNDHLRINQFEGVVWFSFYETGQHMRTLVRYALIYLLGYDKDLLAAPYYEQMHRLIAILNERRILIVLDGLERALVAYRRHDAAQLNDEQIQVDLRACIDPKDEDLLLQLAAVKGSKILISTRLMPSVLEDGIQLRTGVVRERLRGMHPNDALALLQERGISWQDSNTVRQFLGAFDYHPLLIRVVAGKIAKRRHHRGDFDAWYEEEGKALNLFQLDLSNRRSHILKAAYLELSPDKRHLLSQIAAFGDGVGYDALVVLNPYATHGEFDAALTELEDRGFLQWDPDADIYDLHPVVRGFAFGLLDAESRIQTYERIADYFADIPTDSEVIQDIAQISNRLRFYNALLGAQRIDEAIKFFDKKLHYSLLYDLGEFGLILSLTKPLLEASTHDSNLKLINTINTVGLALRQIGDDQAGDYFERRIDLSLNSGADEKTAVALSNYGWTLHDNNRLAAWKKVLDLHRNFAVEANLRDRISMSLMHDMLYYLIIGDLDTSLDYYSKFLSRPPVGRLPAGGVVIDRYRATLAFYRGEDGLGFLQSARKTVVDKRSLNELMIICALEAEFVLTSDPVRAAAEAEEAIKIARQTQSFHLAPFLGILARIRVAQNRFDEADQAIQEALTTRTVKFERASLYNSAATVFRVLNDVQKSLDYAQQAYILATADGLPYVNWWELERATKNFQELNLIPPEVQQYNQQTQVEIPHETRIHDRIAKLREVSSSHSDA